MKTIRYVKGVHFTVNRILMVHNFPSFMIDVGKFSQFLTPTPLPSAVFSEVLVLLSVGKFGQFLTPTPLKNADVINGWSLLFSSVPTNARIKSRFY